LAFVDFVSAYAVSEPEIRTTSEFRVRYAETDQMGVVYHANYLVWCEIGRTDLIRTLGTTYADLERRDILLAVSDASLRFHASARYDDLILVETTLEEVRSRAITFGYRIERRDGENIQRLVSARTTLIAVDRNGRPRSMPAELLRMFGREPQPGHA
jgi:acyl-CoA thioester hydrolase